MSSFLPFRLYYFQVKSRCSWLEYAMIVTYVDMSECTLLGYAWLQIFTDQWPVNGLVAGGTGALTSAASEYLRPKQLVTERPEDQL